jgi:purine catabolism regulator
LYNRGVPTPTIRVLLSRRELSLTLLTPPDARPTAALDAPVSWVHSSDLTDPTPFVIPGQVLLTTGTQFGAPDAARASTSAPTGRSRPARSATEDDSDYVGDGSDYDGYVTRLVEAGVIGLGFGVEVVRQTPPGLLDACVRAGLPLFEVPYRTPFIAVARYVADLVAEQAYARSTWALAALRAVSLTALRPDGLADTLTELAHQLGRWVALVDAHGRLELVSPPRALSATARAEVEAEAKRMLAARRRAASTVSDAGATMSLQTIGASDRLLGVLAHGGPSDLDHAAQQVVTSAVAIAGLALDRGLGLESARAAMRAVLSRSLASSAVLLDELAADSGIPAADSAAIARARARVEAAQRAAVESADSHRGGTSAASGRRPLLALHDENARERASTLLAPLTAHDADGTLARSLLVWLEHNGVYDAAARELGVHRHTVTARIRTAERALGRDLSAFADRAEVWAALIALSAPDTAD